MQVVINDVLITYQDVGTGPVLVCVHGWMHSLDTYQQITERLKNTHRIIALDLPNFGKSQVTESVQSIDDFSIVIAEFAKKLNLESYTLVGHSMGAQIAIYGTAKQILTPQKLILIGAAGVRDNRKTYKLFLKTASKVVRHMVPKAMKTKFYKAIGSDYNPDLSDIHKKIINKTLTTDVQALAAQITIPALLIYGDKDVSTPSWMGERLKALIPGAQLQLIPGEQHWPHQTATDQVVKYMQEFLS